MLDFDKLTAREMGIIPMVSFFMGSDARKPVIGVSNKVRFKPPRLLQKLARYLNFRSWQV